MTQYHTDTAADWDAVAHACVTALPPSDRATVLALSGTLGAGKTTFVQALARSLGVTERVVSPTFMLMQIYNAHTPCFDRLVHIDAYRFVSEDEAAVLRLHEYLDDPKTLVAVEWPEQIPNLMPKDAIAVDIIITPEDGRTITVV